MDSDGINIIDIRPETVKFSPSMWSDTFASFSLDEQVQNKYAVAIEKLKEEAMNLLMAEENTTAQTLVLIDTLERLGVAYHFKNEIDEKLELISTQESTNYDLFTTALRFRLLRQHRYNAPSGVFEKFKKNNEFGENLICDVKGLLSLYEAAQLRIHGEDILDEVDVFTTRHLNRVLDEEEDHYYSSSNLDYVYRQQVKQALRQKLHRSVTIIEARKYISIYEKYDEANKNDMLLQLAKLNFNFLQNVYKNELSILTRWWNAFDLKSKLSHSRDRVVESYLWGVSNGYEPKYSYVRIATTKSVQLAAILDDTYDNYATLEEAQLFTDLIQRWDINEIDRLPTNPLKAVYGLVLSLYDDLEREATNQGKSFEIGYVKETVKQLCDAYNKELKWFIERKLPTFEEYSSLTLVTSTIYMMLAFIFPGMKSVSKETIDWLMDQRSNKMVSGAVKLSRCLQNTASYERENRQDQMLTGIDCYMVNYGVTKQVAMKNILELAEDGWKEVNREWINTERGKEKDLIVEIILNYSRSAEFYYRNFEDEYSNPENYAAPHIVALFVDPIPLV